MKEVSKHEFIALRRKVFVYPSSDADEMHFKQRIVDYLNGKTHQKTLTSAMYQVVWERNNKGETLKYMTFNDHQQRVYLSSHFQKWAQRMCSLIEKELEKIK